MRSLGQTWTSTLSPFWTPAMILVKGIINSLWGILMDSYEFYISIIIFYLRDTSSETEIYSRHCIYIVISKVNFYIISFVLSLLYIHFWGCERIQIFFFFELIYIYIYYKINSRNIIQVITSRNFDIMNSFDKKTTNILVVIMFEKSWDHQQSSARKVSNVHVLRWGGLRIPLDYACHFFKQAGE